MHGFMPHNDVHDMRLLLILTILLTGYTGLLRADSYEEASSALARGDQQQAVRIFKRLARQEDAASQYQLGMLYLFGQGVDQDAAAGIEWLKRAALNGDYLAANELGQIYMTGRGVAVDEAEAIRWVEQASRIAAQNEGVAEDGCE